MFNDNNTKDKDTTEVSEKEKKETSDKDQPKSDSGWVTAFFLFFLKGLFTVFSHALEDFYEEVSE